MGLLSKIFRPSVKAAEGQYRDGPYLVDGGWIPASWGKAWNFWQMGYSPIQGAERSTMVEACLSAYAQTVAMCPGSHWQTQEDGGRKRITTSALNRILRKPNAYQSISDFLLNLTYSLYGGYGGGGNAYALALRNDRNEIVELHLFDPRQSGPRLAETGEVFYSLGGNEVIERQLVSGSLSAVPARDVLHVRLHTPRHPLKGESPMTAAALSAATQGALSQQQLAFLLNQSRPSGTLNTDMQLTKEQVAELRDRWEEQSRGLNQGGVPILTNGLKWTAMGTTAQDAQLADLMKMTREDIALAFRVPLQVLGLGNQAYASTEMLMQHWIASGLGFALNHIEEAFGLLFGLKGQPDEYLELDTEALLRSALKDRIEALARGVQGGIYSPDEARSKESLPRVPGGHGAEPRVQQQVVPLSFGAQQEPQPPAEPALPPEPAEPDEVPPNENRSLRQLVRERRIHARDAA